MNRRKHAALVRLGFACLAFWACGAWAGASGWRVSVGDVRVIVPVKPGGSFEAKTTSLQGDLTLTPGKPAPLAGELRVDLSTIDTGIELRNRHLQDYLEVEKGEGFDAALLSELRLLDAQGDGFEGRTGFTGTLLLHGTRKQIAGSAKLSRAGTSVRVAATFVLVLSEFGIEAPQYMGVGVGDRLIVDVVFIPRTLAEDGGGQ